MSDRPNHSPQIRTYSLLALGSGIASLSSAGACGLAGLAMLFIDPSAGIVVVVLPVVAFGGAIMGGLALRSIRRSEGRLGGRPIATLGLFVGLGAGVLQTSVTLSALGTIWPVRTVLAPEVDALFGDLGAGRMDGARARLAPSTTAQLDDARMVLFIKSLERELGPYQSAGFGIDVFVESRRRLTSVASRGAVPGAVMPANTPRPVGLTFANSRAIAYVFVDQDAIVKGQVRVSDVLVLLPDDRGFVLLADGEASQAALALGVAVIRESAGDG